MNKRKQKGGVQFVMHSVAMLRSPAFQVLSRSAHKVLARIEIEHCAHGGKDNGCLPVTYDDFCRYGIDRDCIGPAIREATALGFNEVTQHGIAGNAEHRRSNEFRLTYLPDADGNPPTNEWAAIQSVAEAHKIAAEARANKSKRRPAASKTPSRGFSHSQSAKPRLKNGRSQSGFSGLRGKKAQSGKPRLLSRSSSHVACVRESGVPTPPRACPPDPKSRTRRTPPFISGSATCSVA